MVTSKSTKSRMYTFSPMMVLNSQNHHCRVRTYTREVLVLSTNLEIQTKHYPLVFRNRRGDEARIKKTCSAARAAVIHVLTCPKGNDYLLVRVMNVSHCQRRGDKVFASGTSGTRANILRTGGDNSGQQRVMKCFNCQGEGHMARQCPKPKRKRDATWFRDKVILVEAQGSSKVLNEEELEFLADLGVAEGLVTQTVITYNAAYQADDLDAYDSNCDDFFTAKVVRMANLSSYGSDVLSKVPHSENTHNDMLNQSVQEMPYSEQTHLDTNSSAQQDAMILSVFKQPSNQVTNCNKVNKDNLIANESLSAELERYKEREKNPQFKDFEKEINYLKQTLSEQSKAYELLTKTFNVFKNDSKEKKAKNIDKEIAFEKKVKELDNMVCKMVQSAQTVHMLTKPQVFYAFWLQTSHPNTDQSASSPVKIEAPRELSKEKVFAIKALENDVRKLKGKYIVNNAAQVSNVITIAPGVSRSTKSSRSKSTDNTKNDRILQISSSTQKKNKVEDHSRIVKSCLNKPNCVVEPSGNANVQHSKLNTNSELMCVKCNSSMFDARHELCFLEFVSDMNASSKSKSVKKAKKKEEWKPTGKVFTKIGYNWRPTGRTFTLVGNACPLTRITATNKVPLREPIPLEVVAQESVVTKVYTRRPKVVQIDLWYLDSGCSNHMTGDRSQLTNFVHKFLGTVKFGNDQIAKIMGYDDYQIGNITISRVYYMEGLGHNLFSVGQFCDSDLEVAFKKYTCFVCNLEGVDLLSGSRETNLYTLSIGDMMVSSPICLLSKASKTKSWLWHRRLSHLNFGGINHFAKNGHVRGLPKLKFEKDHLCSACAMGKSKKQSHKPKSKDTNQEKLYVLHMDLCGPMRVASINRKKYILIIVDDYSRFTWVKCLASKDEAPDFIIKFMKMIQIRLNAPVRNIRTDNGTEFLIKLCVAIMRVLVSLMKHRLCDLHNKMVSLKGEIVLLLKPIEQC
ncbi:retrovirus-related pol polyprotein from transposon TNT 1-94 [Tanacetum coccineum]|uniref:Retrovirus-related pol polyprotein from transposon TNT 1-94 n=1 Tax=Tanacetum coccineum TaxID=301880 RepID=A0ABQ5BSX5_9ASTR